MPVPLTYRDLCIRRRSASFLWLELQQTDYFQLIVCFLARYKQVTSKLHNNMKLVILISGKKKFETQEEIFERLISLLQFYFLHYETTFCLLVLRLLFLIKFSITNQTDPQLWKLLITTRYDHHFLIVYSHVVLEQEHLLISLVSSAIDWIGHGGLIQRYLGSMKVSF